MDSLRRNVNKQRLIRFIEIICIAFGLAFILFFLTGNLRYRVPTAINKHLKSWHGWENIEYMFVFGDSFSTTSFNPHDIQPNIDNPFGNPPFPEGVESGGPNWVHFSTATYNKSFIRTYNLAVGAGTVDRGIIAPFFDYSRSLNQQIPEVFLPLYANPVSRGPTIPTWQAHNTLFALFYGVNDIAMASRKLSGPTPSGAIFASYAGAIETMYQAGARNFLFVNVPPLDRAPQGMEVSASASDILDWNARLAALRQHLTATYSDMTTFVFDFYGLFDRILKYPQQFEQTRQIKNTTNWCFEYIMGTPEWHTLIPSCNIPVSEYFWENDLHPTWPVHNATAATIIEDCFGKRGPKGFCS